MKKPNDHIFQLIQAMSPAEKRYFRLHFASETNQLTGLFDAINRMKSYDEEALKEKLDASVAKNIKVYKIQLQDLLLKSLSSFHSKRNKISKVRMWLEEADILAEKQLFEQALDRLAKARAVCMHYQEYTYLLEISAREFHLKHVSNDRIGISTHPYFEETGVFIGHIQTALSYHKRSSEWIDYLKEFYYRPPDETERQKALRLLNEESKVAEGTLSFRAKLSRNTLFMSAYKLINEGHKEGLSREANVKLFHVYPQFKETMPFHYIAVLRNLMNFSLEYKDFDNAQICIEAGLSFIQQNPTFISQLVYFHFGVLEANFECRNWEHILRDWEQPIMENLKKQGIAGERIAMLCYIYFAVTCQILNKSAKVQFYLRKASECREDIKLYFAELLFILDLISHYEAGDDFLVAKQIKALKRKQPENPQESSPLFQEFIKILGAKKTEDRRRLASELLQRLPEWEESPLRFMIQKNSLHHWLQAVANNRPFSSEMYLLKPETP